MSNNSSVYPCMNINKGLIALAVTVVVTPLHVLILFTLTKYALIQIPRIKILLCLSLSHLLQTSITVMIFFAVYLFAPKSYDMPCIISRKCLHFISTLTVVVSSFAVILLSVERYIACIHGLRFYQIVTNRRVIFALVLIWSFGILCATMNLSISTTAEGRELLIVTPVMRVIIVVIEIPTCFTLIVIQAKLFITSRQKMVTVQPGIPVSSQAEQSNFRKKQLRVAFVAAIVAFTYILFTLPGALHGLFTLKTHGLAPVQKYNITSILWMLNALTDPIVYGFGMRDTRKALFKQIKKLFAGIFCQDST